MSVYEGTAFEYYPGIPLLAFLDDFSKTFYGGDKWQSIFFTSITVSFSLALIILSHTKSSFELRFTPKKCNRFLLFPNSDVMGFNQTWK